MISRLSMLKNFTNEQGGMMKYKTDINENLETEERRQDKPFINTKWNSNDVDANPSPAFTETPENKGNKDNLRSSKDSTGDEESHKMLRQLEVREIRFRLKYV